MTIGKQPPPPPGPPADAVSNVVVALTALSVLGGAERLVDIEEVALMAFKMAPERFGWRTRRDLPSWERVRTSFVHANQSERRHHRPPLVSSNTDGESWRLTAEGVVFVQRNANKIQSLQGSGPRTRRTGKSAERTREIRRHPVFCAFARGTPVEDIQRYQLADLLLCPPDSSVEGAHRKVNAAKAAAVDAGDQEVATFLERVEEKLGELWS